ncbi:glycosyltransferase family 4 protein [Cloacibacillus evryensis]|uniref:glycosyltransferase family 4 protein n=1 Tax=Cloacibacillus evryensis TaxID=508460 RepID=UPI0026DEC7E0|nr:glycosyltransferase family 4 protein [Cloacibacillus evryensis]
MLGVRKEKNNMPKLLMVTTIAATLKSFLLPHVKLMQEQGWIVDGMAYGISENTACADAFDSCFEIQWSRNPLDFINMFRAVRQVRDVVKTGEYDIVHVHTPIAAAVTRFALRKSQKKKEVKVIYTAHGFHFYKGAPLLNWLVYYPIEKFLSRYTDVLITINKEDFARAKTFHAKKVEYIPGVGIDIDKIQNVSVDKCKKRKKLGIPEDAFLIISVGELNKNKNHEIVIKAISMLSVNENVCYIIAGTGPLHDYLQSLIDELGLNSKIHLLGYRTDVIELLKISDCFVFPSKREGLGLAALESMAAGLPLISTYIGGIRDYTNDGTGCCITDPLDAKAMEEAIQKMRDDPVFRANCEKNNKEIVIKFDLKISLKIMKQAYEICNVGKSKYDTAI